MGKVYLSYGLSTPSIIIVHLILIDGEYVRQHKVDVCEKGD